MARPESFGEPTRRLDVRIPESLWRRLDGLARRNGVTRTDMAIQCLEASVKLYGKREITLPIEGSVYFPPDY